MPNVPTEGLDVAWTIIHSIVKTEKYDSLTYNVLCTMSYFKVSMSAGLCGCVSMCCVFLCLARVHYVLGELVLQICPLRIVAAQ